MVAVELLILLIASICDIHTRTVPLSLTPVAIGATTFYLLFEYMQTGNTASIFVSFGCGIGILTFFYISMKLTKIGGADCLIASTIGFSLGCYGLWALLFAFLLNLPYVAALKVQKNEHEYPFVPFLTAGYIGALIFMCQQGISFAWLF